MPGPRTGPKTLGDLVLAQLSRSPRGRPWRVTVGRPYPGSYGIARSYEEAREGLTMAVRLHLDTPWSQPNSCSSTGCCCAINLPSPTSCTRCWVNWCTRAAEPNPLLATLDAYFATGGVTTETARRLHLSVRAVTYRLDRINTLTGCDPTDPAQRFTINTAVLGAKLLGWPKRDLTIDR